MDYALDLGFDEVAFTSADPFHQLSEELDQRYQMYRWVNEGMLQLHQAVDPKNILPSARSLIVLLFDYHKQSFPPALLGKIGKAYLSRLYFSKNRIFGSRVKLFRSFLEGKGIQLGMRPAMADRQAAVRAGLGFFGCNTFLYSKSRGSYVAPLALAVDKELEVEVQSPSSRCTEDCQKCISSCPTGALYAPFRMNPWDCIAFHTYATGNFPGAPEQIPYRIREKMGSWIYGCDVCQDVCPRNQRRLRQELPPDSFLEKISHDITLLNLLHMSDDFYHQKVQPLMYGYIWNKKYLQRNAAIALGNTGDPSYAAELGRALKNPEEMVRGYTAWALGALGGAKSRTVLEQHRKIEDTPWVQEEVSRALSLV